MELEEEPVQEDVDTVRNYTTPDGVEQCSIEDIKGRVDFDMRDYYIYYDQVPELDLDSFDTAEALIAALRVEPDIFSNVQDAVTQTNLALEGTRSGFGFWFLPGADNTVRFRESRLGSPADIAGILRGDELIAFNGSPIAQVTNQQVRDALADETSTITMTIRTGSDAPRDVSISYASYRWQTAGRVERFPASTEPDSPSVGYIQVRQFLATTQDEIDSGLQNLIDQGGIDELIVDLRYNPGGLTRIARQLASAIAGEAVAGQVFVRYTVNDKYATYEPELFDTVPEPLNLPRVFVLTTSLTASASEAFINSLKPFINVVVIGDTTDGKPFSSFILPYCGKTINAMNALRTNSAGVSVLGGIQPDCAVQDDWVTASNSSDDPLTGEALYFISNDACSANVQSAVSSRRGFASAIQLEHQH